MRLRPIVTLLFATALVAAACGSDDDASSVATDAPAAETPAEELGTPTAGSTLRESIEIGGVELEYAVVTPDGYRAGETRPLMLALPPGGQDRTIRDRFLTSTWEPEAIERGWVVVSPSAPDGVLFFDGSEELIPEFLHEIAAQYPPEGGRVHLTGVSNGGISAFRVATREPERYASVTVLPGFPQGDADKAALGQLVDIPVTMFVGERDAGWVDAAEQATSALEELGGNVTLNVVPDQGHIISTLADGVILYDLLDSYR